MIQPAKGVLLISEPFLKDPNFMRTVVFLCEHNDEGSIGFVLNRKYEVEVGKLMPELEDDSIPIYYGGPVQMDTIHFIHQYPDEIPGGIQVVPGVYWGGDFEILVALIKKQIIDINKIRFYIGYSGWSSGQLLDELNEKTWLTVQATRKLIFQKNDKEIWKDALKELGGEYEMLINFPIDPQLN
ncbi:MAG: YqgE/AlgH family protein [Chitinophagaceae bacterium]|nr:MAG: YqgE/AlgH family protein [Chitinophagaceae bacterium]